MTQDKLTPEKLDALYALAKEAAPGPWMLQNSCSWRRIGTDPGTCGDVLCPVVRRDGQPDIEAPMGTLEYIAATSPDVVTALIDRVRELEGENAAFRKGLERIAKYPQKPDDELSYTYCRLIARAALNKEQP